MVSTIRVGDVVAPMLVEAVGPVNAVVRPPVAKPSFSSGDSGERRHHRLVPRAGSSRRTCAMPVVEPLKGFTQQYITTRRDQRGDRKGSQRRPPRGTPSHTVPAVGLVAQEFLPPLRV
jgi:hypothetical protein